MKNQLNQHMAPLLKTMSQQPWENKEFYKEYVAQTYHYVFYSCRMLAMAASLTDASRATFYKRAVQHISEESGHEMLAVMDLKHLGGSLDQHPELAVTRAMWESQFFKIQRQPSSLLGYILALELLSAESKSLFEQVAKNYPANCVNFVRVHVNEDPDHVEKAIQQIASLPESEKSEIWRNYEQTCKMFGLILLECAAKAAQRSMHSEADRVTRIAV